MPDHVHTVSIIGLFEAFLGDRSPDCLGPQWDGLVPAASADIGLAGLTRKTPMTLHRNHFHLGQGSDFPAWLCALSTRCLRFQVHSPVDVTIEAPDGRLLSAVVGGIPGASYDEAADAAGHVVGSFVIPFAQTGTYRVLPVAKPDAQPADAFRITRTWEGVTTIVAEGLVRDIPSTGYADLVEDSPTPGRMRGHVRIDRDGVRHDVEFRVVEDAAGAHHGRLRYRQTSRGTDTHRHDDFVATEVVRVTFQDLAQPGRDDRSGPDQVQFSGRGDWNGLAGYTFTAMATDGGSRRQTADEFAVIIRDPDGNVVASVSGTVVRGSIRLLPIEEEAGED